MKTRLIPVVLGLLAGGGLSARVPAPKGGPLGVARRAAPVYVSSPADQPDAVRWVQIDLGRKQAVTAVKLYPAVGENWGRLFRLGFPLRFRIEAAEEPTFRKPLLIFDQSGADFTNEIPTKVETFAPTKPVSGRYVRLTATRLGSHGNAFLLALYRLELRSGSKNVALNQPVSNADGSLDRRLTRGPRPMGDGVVTDHPETVTAPAQWKPVAYRGRVPREGVTLGLIEAGITGNEVAFPMLRRFYDWFNGSSYRPEPLRRGGQGTIADTRLYFTPVGQPRDVQVVQRFYQENYWLDQLARRDTSAVSSYAHDKPHSYLLATLEAYLDLYRATGPVAIRVNGQMVAEPKPRDVRAAEPGLVGRRRD